MNHIKYIRRTVKKKKITHCRFQLECVGDEKRTKKYINFTIFSVNGHTNN